MYVKREKLYFDLQKGSQSANHSLFIVQCSFELLSENMFFQNVGILTKFVKA